jgi:lipopolysaccharide biosynthesis protein
MLAERRLPLHPSSFWRSTPVQARSPRSGKHTGMGIGMQNEQVQPAVQSLAFYLPQFFPIPENDEWWGPGFTEWVNVARARRLFPGHYQPHLPGELGFYDLRLEETRVRQANLAAVHGVTGFCYWHYWFGGRRMLERVVDEVVRSGVPDYPFCLAWANETWGGRWAGAPKRVLIEQTYPGDDDYRRHFDAIVGALHDPRYVRVDGRPLFYVYRPEQLPDAGHFADVWRRLADEAGLPGLFLIGQSVVGSMRWRASEHGFDAVAPWSRYPHLQRRAAEKRRAFDSLVSATLARQHFLPRIYSYHRWSQYVPTANNDELEFPSVIPNWDNTPRAGRDGGLYHGANPQDFARQVKGAMRLLADRPPERRLLFIRSWNEWAEGNHLEPDRRYGRGFLEAFRDAVSCHATD